MNGVRSIFYGTQISERGSRFGPSSTVGQVSEILDYTLVDDWDKTGKVSRGVAR